MNPVWIIDDDRSIRWVFEKALTREEIAFKSFGSAAEALAFVQSQQQMWKPAIEQVANRAK